MKTNVNNHQLWLTHIHTHLHMRTYYTSTEKFKISSTEKHFLLRKRASLEWRCAYTLTNSILCKDIKERLIAYNMNRSTERFLVGKYCVRGMLALRVHWSTVSYADSGYLEILLNGLKKLAVNDLCHFADVLMTQ